MSDEGGGGGGGDGKGGGDSQPAGFSPTGQGVNAPSNADNITAAPTAIPIFGASSDISAGDGSSGASPPSNTATPTQTASIGNAGLTAPASTSSVGATAVSAPAGTGGNPTDLTNDLSARSSTDPNFPNGVPIPQSKPSIPGQDQSLDNLATGATPGGGAAGQPQNLLSPDQLGQPAAPTATTGTAAASTAAKSSSSSGGLLDSLGIKNPLGAAIGAAGLGYSVLQGQKAPAYSPELQAQASALNAQGQQLLSYLQNGNLPPGLQASLDQATSAAKAKIISNFASQGLNTDPTQNTALAQQLAQVDQQALISTAQIGQQLMTTGLQEAGLSSSLYQTLANIDQTQTANIGKSISSFASALSGTGGGINIKLPGTS